MRLELSDNFIIKDCLSTIGNIVDEIVLECDSEGIRLRALDRSHITFVNMELESTLFDEYQCKDPEKISIDASELLKVLTRCKPSDILILETTGDKLVLTFNGDSTRTFKLALIDVEYETPDVPGVDPPATIFLPTSLLEDFLNDVGIFGEKIIFTVDEDYLICTGDNEFGDSEIRYIHGEQIKEVYRSMFNIAKIKDMLKAKKLANTVSLGIGNDLPLILKFTFTDGLLSFLLAPRLEEEV